MRADVTRLHWSYSSVSQYLKCPLQYYFERIAKLPRKGTTDAQVLGSAVHSALATFHRQLQAGEATTAGSIRQSYLDAWDGLVGDGQVVALGGKPLGDSRDLGMTLVEVYLEQPPSGTIIAVESPMMTPIANSRGDYLEKPVLIVADLVSRQEDGTLQITEIKTSGRAYSESEVATSLQPTFYANALYEKTGKNRAWISRSWSRPGCRRSRRSRPSGASQTTRGSATSSGSWRRRSRPGFSTRWNHPSTAPAALFTGPAGNGRARGSRGS